MKKLPSTHVWSQSVTSTGPAVSTASAGHPTSALVRLAGRDPIATPASLCQGVIMALVQMLSSVTAKVIGKGPTATSLFAPTAPTATASNPTSASATTDGQERTATFVRRCQDAKTEDALTSRTPASAMMGGRVISATSPHATWTAITGPASPLPMVLPTSASANLDGEESLATNAVPTGDAQTRTTTLATYPTSASASRAKAIRTSCATTSSSGASCSNDDVFFLLVGQLCHFLLSLPPSKARNRIFKTFTILKTFSHVGDQ